MKLEINVMSNKTLVGRQGEVELLNSYLKSDKSEFIAVYGRRRVGKTFLIRQTIADRACFMLTGMDNVGVEEQLTNFWFALRKLYDVARPQSWLEAFDQLERYIESLPEGEKIIFIDELPWFDTPRSNFISAFEHFWNSWASARTDVKLIVCGSATSWMIDSLINNHGGLHNRVTHQMLIEPFTLAECREYFNAYGFAYREREIAECYMIFGGIPYYFSLMNPKESVAQNVDRLLFASNGELVGEFDNLFRSLFRQSADYVELIRVLASKRKGLTRAELLEATGFSNNSKFTTMLTELEKCGFIRTYTSFDSKKRDMIYQLIDSFTRFNFDVVVQNKHRDEAFWTHSLNSPLYRTWSGLAFEILCFNHVPQIKQALGISGIRSNVCTLNLKGENKQRGAQIDLIIDRADSTVNLCEIKYSRLEYDITSEDEMNFINKIERFIEQTKTSKSVIFTMITSSGVKSGKYSGMVQQSIVLDRLF